MEILARDLAGASDARGLATVEVDGLLADVVAAGFFANVESLGDVTFSAVDDVPAAGALVETTNDGLAAVE